jgi:hypothetical protein
LDSKGNVSGKPNQKGFGVVLHMVANAKMLQMVAKYEVVTCPKSKLCKADFWGSQRRYKEPPRGSGLMLR